jgi:aldose 1-epimerase
VISVDGTSFDFKKPSKIKDKFTNKLNSFDENFIINKNSKFIAKIKSSKSNISLRISSNQPGVQFYTGQHLKYSTDRKTIKKYQGMCFETQGFPNAPNNSKFPSTRLDPSQTYKHNIKFEIEEIK